VPQISGRQPNTDPANWELISRALLPFLNGHRGPNYNAAAPEVKPIVMAIAKLKRVRFNKSNAQHSSTRPHPPNRQPIIYRNEILAFLESTDPQTTTALWKFIRCDDVSNTRLLRDRQSTILCMHYL
jgi:hypothetical protein